jgi:hypothetical protein
MTIVASRHGTVELSTVPASPITAAAVYVGLWQSNLIGLKVQRWVNWRLANASAALWTTTGYA